MRHICAISISIVCFCLLNSGCASNQNLVFFTNSSIGVDISSEPETGTPLKFVVGYKRQEGVIDPIGSGYQLHGSSDANLPTEPSDPNAPVIATKIGYFVQNGSSEYPHSVLAKMNFGATAGGTGASAAQWFATGKAAEIVAQQPGIAGAISGDPEVNKAAKVVGMEFSDKRVGYAALSKIYGDLVTLSKEKRPVAEKAMKIISDVDTMSTEGIFNVPLKMYKFRAPNVLEIGSYDPKADQSATGFNKVLGYVSNTVNSFENAKSASINAQGNLVKTDGSPLGEDQRKELIEDLIKYGESINELQNKVSRDTRCIKMVEFYVYNLLLVEK